MSDELKPIDPNHDLVPTLRMMGGLLFDQAADEIDKWRNAYRASVKRPADELWVIGMGCVQKHKIISTPIIINGQLHVYTDTGEGAEIAAPAQPRQPLSEWRDQVEQRLLTWRQRTVNRSGDQLALDDFMDKESLDDLIDFVCDEWAGPVGRLALTNAQVDAHLDAILKASGSALRHYSMSGTREAMRSAVRAIERAITGEKP